MLALNLGLDYCFPVSEPTPDRLGPPSHDASPVSPEPTTPGAQSPSHLHYHSKAQHRRFSMEVSGTSKKKKKKLNHTDMVLVLAGGLFWIL